MKIAKFIICIFFLISIITPVTAQDNTLTPEEREQGWHLLFDGKSTQGWKAAFRDGFPEKGWKLDSGMLIVEPSGGGESTNGGDIVTTDLFSDFELMVDFKLTEGANSGIKYFVDPHQPVPDNPRSAFGLEYQLLDDEHHPDAKQGRDGNRTLGSLYDLITAQNKNLNPIGEWNTARIVSKGRHVEHWLNGAKLLEYERGSNEFNRLIKISKYKDLEGFGLISAGRILLQDHGDRVYFKNIKIRLLK